MQVNGSNDYVELDTLSWIYAKEKESEKPVDESVFDDKTLPHEDELKARGDIDITDLLGKTTSSRLFNKSSIEQVQGCRIPGSIVNDMPNSGDTTINSKDLTLKQRRDVLLSETGKTAELFDFDHNGNLDNDERDVFHAYIGDRLFDINMDGKLDKYELAAKKMKKINDKYHEEFIGGKQCAKNGRRVTTIEDNHIAMLEEAANAGTVDEALRDRANPQEAAKRELAKAKKEQAEEEARLADERNIYETDEYIESELAEKSDKKSNKKSDKKEKTDKS